MKRKRKGSTFSALPPVRLYRDDVEHLIELMQGTLSEDGIQISDKDFDYDSLEEFRAQRGDGPHALELVANRELGGMRITFGNGLPPYAVFVQSLRSKDDVILRVEDFLKSKSRWGLSFSRHILRNKVYLVPRHEAPTFFERNGERLLVLSLGSLLTLLIQWLWGHAVGVC